VKTLTSFIGAGTLLAGLAAPAAAELAFHAIEGGKAEARVEDSDIESVVIRERRDTVTGTGQITVGEPYYQVTFVLRPRGAKILNEFLTKRIGQRLGVRLGGTDLGTVRVVEAFSGNEYTTYFKERRADVERMLGSVKAKLTWK
jgi:hypothetical protein